jgi:hypothetical protein
VYPDYVAWIPVWGEALRPMLAAVPERARARIPAIHQLPGDGMALSDMDGPVTWTLWSTDPAQHQSYLIAQVARALTGLNQACAGDSRVLVALWLVGRGGAPLLDAPSPGDWERHDLIGTEISMGANGAIAFPGQLGGARYGAADVGYARRLLRRPDAAERVRANWDRLTTPGTTVEQALPLLGLREEFTAEDLRCP